VYEKLNNKYGGGMYWGKKGEFVNENRESER
jgi:hypothetical protein